MKLQEQESGKGAPAEPAYEGSSIAIAFASDDRFCPYMSVMIRSIMDHADENKNYDILVLTRDIQAENKNILEGMAKDKNNISIRFIYVDSYVKDMRFFTGGGNGELSADTYSRLLLPYVTSEKYHKVLYLDGDMIATTDVALLYDVDVEGYLLAACRDTAGLAAYYDVTDNRKQYRDEILQLEKPNDYFIAGTLLMNLDEFRKNYTARYLLEFATSRDWQMHDQDVLNVLCKDGRAKIIDLAWNVLRPYHLDYLPEAYYKEYLEASENPKIIHYGGAEKPWKTLDAFHKDEFWEVAARSPYFQEIIYRMMDFLKGSPEGINRYEHPDAFNEEMVKHYAEGRAGFRHIPRMMAAWFKFKLKKLFGTR